jgi:hypothetical protein
VSADKKRELIELVRRSPQPKRATITELGLSRLPFYRWQRRYPEQGEAGLVDRKPEPGAVWKRLRPGEEDSVGEQVLKWFRSIGAELIAQATYAAFMCVNLLLKDEIPISG